jgi:hypothetical protein
MTMKTIASVALAGGLATALAVAAIAPASAHDWRPSHPRSHNWYPGPGAGFATGAAIGLAYGALAAPYYGPPAYAYYPPAPPPPVAYGWSEHVNWCAAQYNTYDPSSDNWVDYYGVAHRCVGP